MKKLVASVGMVALGVSGAQTASAQDWSPSNPAKPWSLSATVRGFYDDNRDTLPDNVQLPQGYKKDSFGFEIAPSANIKYVQEQTAISAGYTYSYKWYDEKSIYNSSRESQSHEFNVALDHAFSSRLRMNARDSFVIGQEPDQLRAANTMSTLTRVPGDNVRNEARIGLGADITPVFGVEAGYANSFYDYKDQGTGSLSARLDRFEHVANLDGRWTISPTTVGVVGYAYGETDYTRKDFLDFTSPITSKMRDNRSHYVYVGADHSFSTDLSGSIRAGGRYNDYFNDPLGKSDWSPYARASLRYAYLANGSAELGVSYDRTATDVFAVGAGGDFVRDMEAASVYANIRQQLMPKVVGSLSAQFQNDTFNGGPWNNKNEQFYLVGLNLEYQFNHNVAAHVGYNYDLLNSDIPSRKYDRNRVYVGVTATY